MVVCSPFLSEGVVPFHSLAVHRAAVALSLVPLFAAGVGQTRVLVLSGLQGETGRQMTLDEFHRAQMHRTAHHQGCPEDVPQVESSDLPYRTLTWRTAAAVIQRGGRCSG